MSEHILTVPERLAILETKVEHLSEQQTKIMEKLDALLAFKHKGLGALGFVTAILGSSILGGVFVLVNWLKGLHA